MQEMINQSVEKAIENVINKLSKPEPTAEELKNEILKDLDYI